MEGGSIWRRKTRPPDRQSSRTGPSLHTLDSGGWFEVVVGNSRWGKGSVRGIAMLAPRGVAPGMGERSCTLQTLCADDFQMLQASSGSLDRRNYQRKRDVCKVFPANIIQRWRGEGDRMSTDRERERIRKGEWRKKDAQHHHQDHERGERERERDGEIKKMNKGREGERDLR